jgi:hypothetical protein
MDGDHLGEVDAGGDASGDVRGGFERAADDAHAATTPGLKREEEEMGDGGRRWGGGGERGKFSFSFD